MLTLIARRFLAAVPMLLGVSIAAFLLLHALPGDPAQSILGQRATPENVERFRQREGLNDPLPQQYARFMDNALHGDLGTSHRTNRPVLDELKERVPATIELAFFATLLAAVIGISLGVLAAVRPRSIWDFLCLGFALIGVSMPIFWLGFLLQKFLSGTLKILPFGERLDIAKWPGFESETGFYLLDSIFVYRNVELTLDVMHHLLLPSLVLATIPMALIARMTRANMLEVLSQDFIRTAKAKGLAPRQVITRHALRNALIPVITAIGTQFGYLLGGAVLTETIFSWRGLGTYVVEAIDALDAKPLQASVMVVALVFISVNLLTDLSYAVIDPRLRHSGGKTQQAVPGIGWLAFAPWAVAGLPWLSLLVLVLLKSTGRIEPGNAAFDKAMHTTWIALGAEGLALLVVLAVRGLIWQAVSSIREMAVTTARHGLAAVKDLSRFLLGHKPALAGLALIMLMLVAAIGAPWIAPHDPMQGLDVYNHPASSEYWFGTDSQGRDLFSRLVWGSRTTLRVALAATLLSLMLGTIVGAVAGYFGGAADSFFMRGIDFMMSFPSFLLAVVTVAILGKNLDNLIWAVGLVGVPLFARQVRAEVLRVKALDYVESARALGFGRVRILATTVLPNCITPIIVLATLGMGGAILDVAGLAFLGLGGDPFVPEWGLILKHGWDQSSKGAFQVGVAGVCILCTVLGFNLFGDGLRDWLDPRSRRV
ncbi:MAG: ABC transporter permease subunit [Planctomycetes bacterium]|nr:ABC transporter permease subunit [Planctomycetota bacterium]